MPPDRAKVFETFLAAEEADLAPMRRLPRRRWRERNMGAREILLAVVAPCCKSAVMASKTKRPYTIVRGGKLLDIAKRKAVPVDILIKGDTIAEIGRPGLAAPARATLI